MHAHNRGIQSGHVDESTEHRTLASSATVDEEPRGASSEDLHGRYRYYTINITITISTIISNSNSNSDNAYLYYYYYYHYHYPAIYQINILQIKIPDSGFPLKNTEHLRQDLR